MGYYGAQVVNAITRVKKTQIVTTLKEKLDESSIVFGMRFKGLTVQTVQKFRRGLPKDSTMYVCKNSLMKVAVQDDERWNVLAEKGSAGENAWVFTPEDDINATVKHFLKFEAEMFSEAKKTAAKGAVVKKPTELSFIIMDNKLLTVEEFQRCESLPTKKDLITTIARLAKQPATRLATSIKQVPSKLARAILEVSKLDEDQSKLVSEFVKA
ncbi:MAG: hypothetical protein WDW36_009144 [Sanguina aurantia]